MTLPAGFSYIDNFLSPDEQDNLLQTIRTLDFTHDTFRRQTLKRSYAQFGYAYVSTGRKLKPAAQFPDFLTALIEKTTPYTPELAIFNQCIFTHYPKGAGIGWHMDADRFGECIIAVSIAGAARLQFRPNGSTAAAAELIVAPGSLYVMTGPARWGYQHQVVSITKWRLEFLRRSAAKVRFVSMEPILDSMLPLNLDGINQVIVGGESGRARRPFNMRWAREVRDACAAAEAAFFFKQDSELQTERRPYLVEQDGTCWEYRQYPGELTPPTHVQPERQRNEVFSIIE
jgi:alkylated DNA repair dioxygenase AlkB